MVVLEEDQSFSLTANVTSPGYQSIVLRGYLVSRRSDGVYMAPLIPRLFYGADGSQLGASWRQYLPAAGEQVILSRVGGYPKVPREELWWRKVSDREVERVAPAEEVRGVVEVSPYPISILAGVIIGAAIITVPVMLLIYDYVKRKS